MHENYFIIAILIEGTLCKDSWNMVEKMTKVQLLFHLDNCKCRVMKYYDPNKYDGVYLKCQHIALYVTCIGTESSYTLLTLKLYNSETFHQPYVLLITSQ